MTNSGWWCCTPPTETCTYNNGIGWSYTVQRGWYSTPLPSVRPFVPYVLEYNNKGPSVPRRQYLFEDASHLWNHVMYLYKSSCQEDPRLVKILQDRNTNTNLKEHDKFLLFVANLPTCHPMLADVLYCVAEIIPIISEGVDWKPLFTQKTAHLTSPKNSILLFAPPPPIMRKQ